MLLDPIRIRIGDANAATTDVEQKLMYVGNEMGKLLAMRQLIQVCTCYRRHRPESELAYATPRLDLRHRRPWLSLPARC